MSDEEISYFLKFGDVIRILRLIDETPFRELQLELGDFRLHVVQDKKAPAAPVPELASTLAAAHPAAPAPERKPARERAPASVALPGPAVPSPMVGEPVLAPLAGTFYRAPSPGEPPYVEVGATVNKGDVVGILEIMKLMNHVTAPCSGVIAEIRAKNEEFVEYGQVLAVITPGSVE